MLCHALSGRSAGLRGSITERLIPARAARHGNPAIHGRDQTVGDPQAKAEAAAAVVGHDLLEAPEDALC